MLYHSNHWQYNHHQENLYATNFKKVKRYSPHTLPVSVTQPNSLITWGWGFSFFITSSSDRRSFLSEAGAFAKKKHPKKLLNFFTITLLSVVLSFCCSEPFSVFSVHLTFFVLFVSKASNWTRCRLSIYSVLTYLWTQPYLDLHLLVIGHRGYYMAARRYEISPRVLK